MSLHEGLFFTAITEIHEELRVKASKPYLSEHSSCNDFIYLSLLYFQSKIVQQKQSQSVYNNWWSYRLRRFLPDIHNTNIRASKFRVAYTQVMMPTPKP